MPFSAISFNVQAHTFFNSPSFLVGRGAHEWAVRHGIPPCPSEKMATSEYFLSMRYVVLEKQMQCLQEVIKLAWML